MTDITRRVCFTIAGDPDYATSADVACELLADRVGDGDLDLDDIGTTAAIYDDGGFSELLPSFRQMVAETVKAREDDEAERIALNRDYYAGLGVRTGRPW